MKNVIKQTVTFLRSAFVIPALVLGMAFGLVACEAPKTTSDYREDHNVTVIEETISMEISGLLIDELSGAVFSDLMHEYHTRAKSSITIEVRRFGQADVDINNSVSIINDALIKAGVSARNAVVLESPAGDNLNAVISFTVYTAQVPECEDWTSGTFSKWSNATHSNFGCSTQRNIGLMVANPGDLVLSETRSGFSGIRGAVIVRSHTAGAAAPAAN